VRTGGWPSAAGKRETGGKPAGETARTWSPRSNKARTSEDPMKPAAPVTRYLAISS